MRRLCALIDREPFFGSVPVGDHRARLEGDAGVPAEDKFRFHHRVGIGERLIDLAGVEITLEGQIVAERGVDHRGLRIERGAHVRHRLQFPVFDPHEFRGVLGHGAIGRHNGGDGLALPAHTINRNRVLRRRFEALQMREYADPGRNNRCKLRAGPRRR